MADVGTIDVLGREVTVKADKSGMWDLYEGETFLGRGTTLDKARVEARKKIKELEVTVSVPFITKGGERGVADRLHGKTRAPLATMEDGHREDMSGGYRSGEVFKPDTPSAIIEEYIAAQQAQSEASARQRAIDKEWGMNLREEVRRAVEKAAAEQAEEVPA